MQLTGCHNGNEKRNATCAASKTSKVPTQDALLLISYSMAGTRAEVFKPLPGGAETGAEIL